MRPISSIRHKKYIIKILTSESVDSETEVWRIQIRIDIKHLVQGSLTASSEYFVVLGHYHCPPLAGS